LPDIQEITLAGGKLTGARIGAGRDLLVIHSLLADRTAFDPVLPWLAERFRVKQVPSLALVVERRVVSRLEGRATAPRIESMLEPYLPETAAA